jgi:hypothetical protein
MENLTKPYTCGFAMMIIAFYITLHLYENNTVNVRTAQIRPCRRKQTQVGDCSRLNSHQQVASSLNKVPDPVMYTLTKTGFDKPRTEVVICSIAR